MHHTIVLGLGGMGRAAAYHLARRGRSVPGLERFDIPHAMGSSHGLTRIIRLAYHEHPSYVPLLQRGCPDIASSSAPLSVRFWPAFAEAGETRHERSLFRLSRLLVQAERR